MNLPSQANTLHILCQTSTDSGLPTVQSVGLTDIFTRPMQRHWLNLTGSASLAQLHHTLESYHLHPLVLEDMSSKSQRAKIEDYGDYLFVVLRGNMFTDKQQLKNQLLYMIVAKDFFISYHPKPLLIEEALQERLQLRQTPRWYLEPDFNYLLYVHLDCWIDVLMNHVDILSSKVDKLEGALLQYHDVDLLPRLHRMKHEASKLRRSVVPLRDVLYALMRNEYGVLSSPNNGWYLRDTYDHCLQLLENLDFSRESLSSMIEMSLGSQSNRMNHQMRLLTAVSMIFMPLTLITGIYGMNFEYMPELRWHYGYFMILGLMFTISLTALFIFSRRKWL